MLCVVVVFGVCCGCGSDGPGWLVVLFCVVVVICVCCCCGSDGPRWLVILLCVVTVIGVSPRSGRGLGDIACSAPRGPKPGRNLGGLIGLGITIIISGVA